MYRVLPVVLLVLSGCREPGAVQALVQVEADVQATCIALDLLSTDGELLKTQLVPRPTGKDDVNIAIFQKGTSAEEPALPDALQLQARALWGTECQEPLFYNGKSSSSPVAFKAGEIQSVTLPLSRPDADEDSDRDGFVADSQKGPDCDDTSGQSSPVAQEACDASADLNCNKLLGCDDAMCSAATCSRPVTSLAFSAVGDRAVDECVEVSVVRRGRDGEPTDPNHPTELQLGTDALAGLTFHEAPGCATPARTSFLIAPKESSVRFFAKGTRAGARTLFANASGVAQASLPYNLIPGPTAQVRFTSEEKPVLAGECLPVTLERQDKYGNATSTGPGSVTLAPTSGTETAFYSEQACGSGSRLSVAEAEFGVKSSLDLYFRSELANVFVLRASGIGADATRSQTVNPAPPQKLKLTLTPPETGKTLLAGECSRAATVEATDAFGNRSPPVPGTSVTLSAPPNKGVGFYGNAGCTVPLADAALSLGDTGGIASFHYKIKTGGEPIELTASLGSFTDSKSQTVTPAVRRGACTLAANEASVECPLGTNLNNRKKSFVVFQATTTEDTPRTSFIRCQLKSDDKVTCNRQIGGGAKVAQIQWQVVEMASGLKVQQLESACNSTTGASIPIPIPEPIVDPSKAFLLFSGVTKDGTNVSANEFVTVQFSADHSKVELTMDPLETCSTSANYTVQVVEWEGLKVKRGLIPGPITSSPFYSTGDSFTEMEARQSIVLSTFRLPAGDDQSNLCNRMVRAEILPSEAKVGFTRGFNSCNAPELTGVAWERIQFPSNTTVQARTLEVGDGVATAKATLSPVDMSRTLLLASNQQYNGQGNGETSHRASDLLGIGTGRLLLTSPTELEVRRDAYASPADPSKPDAAKWTVYAVQLEP